MTSIAAIVCAHTLDRWGDIEHALTSLRTQTRPADQIVLSVDNNQPLHDAAAAAFDDVTVVHNTGRRGVSGARNAAARASTCDVLAFLDDDAVADRKWIERLIIWYDDDAVLGVGGHAEPAWDGRGPKWFPPSFNWVIGCSHSGIADTPAPVRNFIGCNMSIRRSAWQAVDGFDESIGRVGADGGGGDETDFCLRLTELLGGTIMNDPSAIVAHRVPTSRQTLSYFLKRCHSEGRSKAHIAARAGSGAALSEERKHLRTELPRSFMQGLSDTFHGDVSGLGRSFAIALGTAATGVGYVGGSLRQKFSPTVQPLARVAADFSPVHIQTIDLDSPIAEAEATEATGGRAMVIVRRGWRLVAVQRRESLPALAALRTELETQFPGDTLPLDLVPETAGHPTAAVVIATKDRTESLRRCLESLSDMTRQPQQLIVVDNVPSTDDTEKMAAEWNSTPANTDFQVTYVRCSKPGLAAAHNAALPHLTSELVAFTDDDVIVDPYWLERLIAGFGVSKQVACVTGSILPAVIETWPQEWVETTSNYTKGMSSARFSLASPPDDPLFPFTAGSMGSGANMAFTADWLATNGGFDEALGAGTTALGGDDLRAFYDVVATGHELVFSPHAVIFHHHHNTAEAIERQAYGYGAGLTAYLASVIRDKPSTLPQMLGKAPKALRHAARVTAAPEAASFPGDRRRALRQRVGMFTGPFRYIRSRG